MPRFQHNKTIKKFIKRGTRARIQLLILVFVLVGMIMIAGNISLAVNKKAIDERGLGYFTHDISVGPVFYVFPNRIIAKNIIIKKNTPSLGQSSFVLSKIEARFSLWELLVRGNFRVSDVTVYLGDVSYYALSQFLEGNYQKILEMIRNSPDHDIRIRVKEALLDFNQKGYPDYVRGRGVFASLRPLILSEAPRRSRGAESKDLIARGPLTRPSGSLKVSPPNRKTPRGLNYVATEFLLIVRGSSFEGAGFFRTDQYQFPTQDGGKIRRIAKGWPLWYKFRGQLKQDGFKIDHLIFKSGSHYCKLWGSVRSGTLKVNGFMFMDTAKQNSNEFEYSFSRYFKGFSIDNELADINVYILDIDGQANFSFPKIQIEKLNFVVNNIPVTLKGDISLLDPFALEVDVSFRQPVHNNDVFFEKVDMTFTGEWKDNIFDMNGQININLSKNNDLGFAPRSLRVTFKGLEYRTDQYRNAHINLEDCDIAYWTNDNEHRISIRDFHAELKTQIEGLKVIEYSAPFYEGFLKGKLYFDSAQIPSQMTSQMTLADVSTDALEELLIHFAKFNGRMSSTMNFTNIPQLDLSGNITITDGQMTDFNFFNWMSDSFHLPALKAIDFRRASAQFSINQKHVRLFDIHLKTEDVRIRGYFDVNNQNFVSSKLTVALSQDLLRQSPKFKPVLPIFEGDKDHLNEPSGSFFTQGAHPEERSDEGSHEILPSLNHMVQGRQDKGSNIKKNTSTPYLNFEFQLSGSIDTMNFQWLPSQVKRKIQERIPDFIERLIEKNIDEMMEPAP